MDSLSQAAPATHPSKLSRRVWECGRCGPKCFRAKLALPHLLAMVFLWRPILVPPVAHLAFNGRREVLKEELIKRIWTRGLEAGIDRKNRHGRNDDNLDDELATFGERT